MRLDVATDLSDSAWEFKNRVWPEINEWFGGGEIVPVESASSEGFTKDLDTLSGIDAWHIKREESLMRGIASRVQWVDQCWKTFTIRYQRDSGAQTEYEKRLRAIKSGGGYLYPHVTVQAYMTNPKRDGQMLGVAAVHTHDLFLLAENLVTNCKPDDLWGIRRTGNAKFIWISWECVKLNKIKIIGHVS